MCIRDRRMLAFLNMACESTLGFQITWTSLFKALPIFLFQSSSNNHYYFCFVRYSWLVTYGFRVSRPTQHRNSLLLYLPLQVFIHSLPTQPTFLPTQSIKWRNVRDGRTWTYLGGAISLGRSPNTYLITHSYPGQPYWFLDVDSTLHSLRFPC